MANSVVEIRPSAGAVGSEILGVDLTQPLADDELTTIRHTLADRGVIFFRDQHLTPEQQIGFAEQFGPINVNRFFRHVDGFPQIAEVRKEPGQTANIGGGWHTDHSYDTAPALGSILYAREVPRSGGDTLFAGMYAAFDALSDGLKATLERLRGVHSSRHVFGPEARRKANSDLQDRILNAELAIQDAIHPVVIRHPDSRPQSAVCQSGIHLALRWLDRGRIAPVAGLSLPPRGAPGILLPVPLATGLDGVLGQPGDLALRAERLPGRAATDAPHHGRGLSAFVGERSFPRERRRHHNPATKRSSQWIV